MDDNSNGKTKSHYLFHLYLAYYIIGVGTGWVLVSIVRPVQNSTITPLLSAFQSKGRTTVLFLNVGNDLPKGRLFSWHQCCCRIASNTDLRK